MNIVKMGKIKRLKNFRDEATYLTEIKYTHCSLQIAKIGDLPMQWIAYTVSEAVPYGHVQGGGK